MPNKRIRRKRERALRARTAANLLRVLYDVPDDAGYPETYLITTFWRGKQLFVRLLSLDEWVNAEQADS